MMNNFKKIYTADSLKKNRVVTLVALPMEESILVPVSQMIDLMKQGENIIYFSFNHDSIKIGNFLQEALKNEPNPEKITGLNAIFDVHQIPSGKNWFDYIRETLNQVRKECKVNYVFVDIIPYVKILGEDESLVSASMLTLAFTEGVTPIIVKTLDGPVLTAIQNKSEMEKKAEEFMNIDIVSEFSKSSKLLKDSDFVIGIQRERKSFLKKVINFLLFWRKRNNFTLRILKNRNGSEDSFRMNIDMEKFKTEVF